MPMAVRYSETFIEPQQLPSAAAVFSGEGGTLLTMVATDERRERGGYVVRYVFQRPPAEGSAEATPSLVALCATLPAGVGLAEPRMPSLTPALPSADWYEREAHDMLGITFDGHPDPRPLVYHGAWAKGEYPLRKGFAMPHSPAREADGGGYDVPRSAEPGAMEVPVGPIHAGIIEPGHFRFTTIGEEVRSLDARLFFTHRGIEKAAEGLTAEAGLHLAERICGACAASHAVSFAQAVEHAMGFGAPREARLLRTLVLELERLYNHVGDLGNMCAGVGLAFGISQMAILKERLMQLNSLVTGNRFLRGFVRVGGVAQSPSRLAFTALKAEVDAVVAHCSAVFQILADSDSLQDRLETTGVLTPEVARSAGAVGVAARASGIAVDARKDLPYAAYDELAFAVVTDTKGDAGARMRVRFGEVVESQGMVAQVVELLEHSLRPGERTTGGMPDPSGGLDGEATDGEADGGPRVGIGVTESPRGSNVHWVAIGQSGRIERLRVRSASFCNWPVVPGTVPGNIVPDFPLINKSFELCYACLDR